MHNLKYIYITHILIWGIFFYNLYEVYIYTYFNKGYFLFNCYKHLNLYSYVNEI
jgi:hypothetical protein